MTAAAARLWLAPACAYALVSLAALTFDAGVTAALAGLGAPPAAAGCVGYAYGMLAHWALSLRFVFRAEAEAGRDRRASQAFAFFGAGAAGLGVTGATMVVALDLGAGPAAAKALAVAASFVAVFLLRRSIAFPPARGARAP